MSNSNNARQGVRNIPEICFRFGLKKAVICPGSRNAPLILSFTAHPHMECLSITDERSAAYFALGMAQMYADPVAVVCTSGTAVLNLAPAIAEAFYQNIPLIIFTADRPREWIDQADGQTIRQQEIFRNYIKQSFEVPLETVHPDDLWHFNRTIAQAMDTAMRTPCGPVHINVPLREPLYSSLPENFNIPSVPATIPAASSLQPEHLLTRLKKWNVAAKKIIVFGILNKNERLQQIAREMALRNDTLVLAENLSNICGDGIIASPESFAAMLSDDEKKRLQPGILITIGEGLISKRMKQLLRSFPIQENWHIGHPGYVDTYKSLSEMIQTDPADFLEYLHQSTPADGEDYQMLKQKYRELITLYDSFAGTAEHCDLKAIHRIMETIPDDSVVHLANSTPVRYSQLSPSRNNIIYFSNRGTSGIDGCISTAAGSAYASGLPVYIITGDLAFIYDSNSLWTNYLHLNLKIIVLNNNGGNIFTLIDSGPEMERARDYFVTPHRVNIQALAQAYGAGYIACDAFAGLDRSMEELKNFQGTCILEIKTDAEVNTRIFKAFYQSIKPLTK